MGFVDSDDYVDADMYERLYRAIATTHMPIAQAGRDEIDQDGNILPNICEPVSEELVIPAEDFLKELLMHRGRLLLLYQAVAKGSVHKGKIPGGSAERGFPPAGEAADGRGEHRSRDRVHSGSDLPCLLPPGQQHQR